MITHEHFGPKLEKDSMTQDDRIRRPMPERTKPKRNVMGALSQADGMAEASAPFMGGGSLGGHPLAPGFEATAPGPNADPNDPMRMIDEGVRAASDLVDAHIKQGEETAKKLGKGASEIPLGQTDVSGLVTGLVRAYSDVAAVWVDIVGSLASKVEGLGQGGAAPSVSPTSAPAFGLSVSSAGRVETSVEMFRQVLEVTAQPLVCAATGAQITDIRFEAGKLRVTVPDAQAAGTYHALLLSAVDQSPAGALTLQIGMDHPEVPL